MEYGDFVKLEVYRTLDNGKTIRRDIDRRKLYLCDGDGRLMGEILRGSLTAQLLALGSADFGDKPEPYSTSTNSVIGPSTQLPRREPYPWYKRALDRMRGR